MLFLRLTTLKIKLSVFERTTLHPDSMQRYPEVLFSREHRDILINKYIPRLTDLFELLPSQKQATKSQIKKADNPLIPTCRPVRTIESTARVVEFHKGCDSLSPPRTVSSLPKGLKGQGTASREFLRSRTRSRLCVCTHVPADNNTRGVGRNPRDPPRLRIKGRGGLHTRARVRAGVNSEVSRQRIFRQKSFLPPSSLYHTPPFCYHVQNGFCPRIGELSFALRIILQVATGVASKGIRGPGKPPSSPTLPPECSYQWFFELF